MLLPGRCLADSHAHTVSFFSPFCHTQDSDPAFVPASQEFFIISDLDQASSVEGKKPNFRAVLQHGTLQYSAATHRFAVRWGEAHDILSPHNEAGRGMELSELEVWNGKLYSCDDRTGILYEIMNPHGSNPAAVPRGIMMEGNGDTSKGFKCEWMTVKDGHLLAGSFGKEYTNPDGSVKNRNNNWLKSFSPTLALTHVDWNAEFDAMRKKFGYEYPAYLLHETGLWSSLRRQWLFMPRRVSKEPYTEDVDERMGSNMVIVGDESMTSFTSFTAGKVVPTHGFSSAAWVPGSQQGIVLALKSEERAADEHQTTFIMAFDMQGNVLMEESEIPGNVKFEGLAFM